MNIPRAKMSEYVNRLKIKTGYTSLKAQYLEMQSRHSLRPGGDTVPSNSNEMDKIDALQTELLPANPIEERDSKISSLQESLTLSAASNKEKELAIVELEKKLALLKPSVAEVKKLKKDLSTAQKKVDKVYSGSAGKLLRAVKEVDIPLDEEFDSTCALLASSFYDTPLTEEDINKMNTELAPTESTSDVFKPFREEANSFNPAQVERYNKLRNKVVESLKLSVESRRQSLSRSPSRKREKDKDDEDFNKQKIQNNRLSPKNDHKSSGLPLATSKK